MNTIIVSWYALQQALIRAFDFHCYLITIIVVIFLIKRTRGIESFQDVAEGPLKTLIILAISFVVHTILYYITFK